MQAGAAVQVQPVPDAANGPAPSAGLFTSPLKPVGSGCVTVTTLPSVGSAPALRTVSVSRPEYGVVFGAAARRNVDGACAADSVNSGAAAAGAAPVNSSTPAAASTDLPIIGSLSSRQGREGA